MSWAVFLCQQVGIMNTCLASWVKAVMYWMTPQLVQEIDVVYIQFKGFCGWLHDVFLVVPILLTLNYSRTQPWQGFSKKNECSYRHVSLYYMYETGLLYQMWHHSITFLNEWLNCLTLPYQWIGFSDCLNLARSHALSVHSMISFAASRSQMLHKLACITKSSDSE